MPAFYRLTFLPEGRTEDFAGSCGNFYQLNDGNEIELKSRPVWCDQCRKVTHGEQIESVEQLDKEIAGLERLAADIRLEMTRPPLPTFDAPGDRIQREQIAKLQLRRKWRRTRGSPPRCIPCGSSQIVPLEYDRPVRGGCGLVLLGFVGFCDNDWHISYFTPEGQRIEVSP